MSEVIYGIIALAFDIPVHLWEESLKNQFQQMSLYTYAVMPVVETINDTSIASIWRERLSKGESIWIDISDLNM